MIRAGHGIQQGGRKPPCLSSSGGPPGAAIALGRDGAAGRPERAGGPDVGASGQPGDEAGIEVIARSSGVQGLHRRGAQAPGVRTGIGADPVSAAFDDHGPAVPGELGGGGRRGPLAGDAAGLGLVGQEVVELPEYLIQARCPRLGGIPARIKCGSRPAAPRFRQQRREAVAQPAL